MAEMRDVNAGRLGIVVLGIVVGVVLVARSIGTGGSALAQPTPAATTRQQPSGPPPAPAAENVEFRYEWLGDVGLALRVPAAWRLVSSEQVGLVRLAGTTPPGTLAISRAVDGAGQVCDPDCAAVKLPTDALFDPDRALGAARTAVAGQVGSSAWRPADGLSANLSDAERLDLPADALHPRRTYVVARNLSDLFVIVATAGAGVGAEALVNRLLAGVQPWWITGPTARPTTRVAPELGVELDVPDVWTADPATADLRATTFGGGRVTVSTSDEDGVLTVCDPGCHGVLAKSLEQLEARIFRPIRGGLTSGDTVLSDEPARYQLDTTTGSPSYRVIGMVDGVAIHLWVDLRHDYVDASVAEAIAASVRYAGPGLSIRHGDRIVGDGFTLTLPEIWQGRLNEDTERGISVTSGDSHGRLWSCRWSGWNSRAIPCSIVQASTLDELVAAMGIGGTAQDIVLDGEPATVRRVETYEYPARGAQYLVYVMAVHHGQPFVIRMLNRRSDRFDLDGVVAGFRFAD